jgi:ketosteroid isomerase-like protein
MPLPANDVVAIHRVYAAYNHGFDFGTPEDFAAVWVEDGELESPLGSSRGHEKLLKGMRWSRENMVGMRHGTMNVLVDGDGDTAEGTCYLLVYQAREGGVSLLLSGRYDDVLRKDDGQWRFVRRVMTSD